MSLLATVLRVFSSIAGALLPKAKQLYAERSAGKMPGLVPINIADEILDEALNRLCAVDVDQPWWKSALLELGATAIRPEWFKKSHVQEWLSQANIRLLLKSVAKDKLTGAKDNWDDIEALAASYMENSGENRLHAESMISLATAVLKASVMGAIRDPGTAAVVHATATEHRKLLEAQNKNLNAIGEKIESAIASRKAIEASKPRFVPSEHFEAIPAGERADEVVCLAFATHGYVGTGASEVPVCGSLCVITDDPERLRNAVEQIRTAIAADPLIPTTVKRQLANASLRTLVDTPTARVSALRQLSTISFSAYLYYCHKNDFDGMSIKRRTEALLLSPLFHRLRKRNLRIARVNSQVPEVLTLLASARQRVADTYKREPALPVLGADKYAPLEELASFVVSVACNYLSNPQDASVAELFENLRTRVRYAENVCTGEKHLRDVNPLP